MSTAVESEGRPGLSRWRRWLLGAGAVAALVVALVVAGRMSRPAPRGPVAELEAELDASDPGWRLEEIEAAREVIPDEQNSARVVAAVAGALPETWPPEDLTALEEGLGSPARLPAEQLALLRRELEGQRGAVVRARALAGMPHGRHRLRLEENPFDVRHDDQQRCRAVTALLLYDAWFLAHDGDARRALASCRAAVNAARSIGDEPFLQVQIIRIACLARAGTAIEGVLALAGGEEAELKALAGLLAEEERHPLLAVAWRGERAWLHALMAGVSSGRLSFGGVDGGVLPDWPLLKGLRGRELRARARADHPALLELYTGLLDAARLPVARQPVAEAKMHHRIKEHGPETFVGALAPDVRRIGQMYRRYLAQVRCLRALVALERHRLAKGGWPATLAELAPGLLDGVPADPFDGRPLRYARRAGGVVVYSVGADGADDGGALDRKRIDQPGADLGYRLWDADRRGRPASK
jgi:hypothetical protein